MLAAEPGLVDQDDPTVEALAQRFVHSTVGAILSALAYGVPMDAARPTDAAVALFERLAERDDGLAVVLRAHRLLASELWEAWASFTDERVAEREVHQSLLVASTRQLATYTDRVCDLLTRAWPDARRRRRHGFAVPLEELVSRAVFGSEADAVSALAQVGHPVDAFHVAVTFPQAVDREALESLARRLGLACGAPALVAAGLEDRTIWVALARRAGAAQLEGARPLLDLGSPVGIGDVASGLDGFRHTREQALDALRVGTLSGAPGPTRYRDVALLAVLCADETRARDLARVELGPLAGDDDVAVRLRDTVGTYLAAGESQVVAAQRLFVHEKTVKYRLRQAEELLGYRIGERRSELGAALMVHRVFGP